MIEAFVNKVSHPRGRAIAYMAEASVTVPQVILMHDALTSGQATPTSLAARLDMSLSSVSQMLERLVKLGFLTRAEDLDDRRRKAIAVTPKARTFLAELRALRASEFEAGTAGLTDEARGLLGMAIGRALAELDASPREANGDAQA